MPVLLVLGVDLNDPRHIEIARVQQETNHAAAVVYFAVGDCDASAAAVTGLGGELFMPPMEMGPGKFAGANDPSGAMFFFGSFGDSA